MGTEMKKNIYILISIQLFFLIANLYADERIIISSLNHKLENRGKGQIVLLDPKDNVLLESVMGFMVVGNFFYGWCNAPSLKYYLVDLKNNKVEFFENQESLNSALSYKGMKPLSMKDEITYWDIKKKKTDSPFGKCLEN